MHGLVRPSWRLKEVMVVEGTERGTSEELRDCRILFHFADEMTSPNNPMKS